MQNQKRLLPVKDVTAFRRQLLAWYSDNAARTPWRMAFAASADPYAVWVSEIMLQQTTIKAVTPVYEKFIAQFPNVFALAKASDEDVREAVRGLGYYRRFRMLHAAAKEMAARKGEWPTTFEGWLELPGIGPYTAAAIGSITQGIPEAVLDGNVERVLSRIFDQRLPTNDKLAKKILKAHADELLDRSRPGDFNQAAMELGQKLCTPTMPACPLCPVQEFCLSLERSSQHLAPAAKVKAAAIDVHLDIFVPRSGKDLWLHQRPANAKFLREVLGFPTLIRKIGAKSSNDWDGEGYALLSEKAVRNARYIGQIKHSITNHRITARVHVAELNTSKGEKVSAQDCERRLISNLDRKALMLFMREY